MIYLIFFFIILNVFLFKFFNRISQFFPEDHIDIKRKKNYKKIPLAGGSIILLNILILFCLSKFYIINYFNLSDSPIVFYSIVFFLLGYADDRFDLSANIKLIFQTILALHFFEIHNDYLIKDLRFLSLDFVINLRIFSLFFSVLALLLFINAINMFDGINGQVCAYSIFFLSILFFKNYQTNLIIFLIIFLISFFALNILNKAYLGSSGVFLISFILSFFSIDAYKNKIVFADEIFLIMLLPGLDMLRLFIQRVLKKKNPFSPDNEHLHHYLNKIFNPTKSFIITITVIIFSWISNFYFKQYVSIFITIVFYFFLILLLKIRKVSK